MEGIENVLLPRVIRTQELIAQAKQIKNKPSLSDDDLRRLAELRIELVSLCPALRYAWREGIPIIDVWQQLIEIERSLLR
jgi:hypothetical protein